MIQTLKTLLVAFALVVAIPTHADDQPPPLAPEPYPVTDRPCDQYETQTVYVVTQVLRGESVDQIKHVQGFAAAGSKLDAAKMFTVDNLRRYPGYSAISTLVTALPSARMVKTSARCWPTI